jgi:UDPglucose 6-dehydrogenase
MGSDTRIGKRFLFPGVGYGGSCFPKDVQALVHTANQHDYDFQILKSVMEVNTRQKTVLSKKISDYFGGDLAGKTIAIWGLAFKPNTDDIREAPALYIIDELLAQGAKINAFDPEGMPHVAKIYGDKINLVEEMYEALNGAHALAIVTEWSEFRTPTFSEMAELMHNKVIFDGRNVYDIEAMQEIGFEYYSIGREVVRHNP